MRSFAKALPALLCLLIVPAPLVAQSANARQVYNEALKREVELRRELDAHQAPDPVAPLLQRIRTLVGAYSDMARLFPNNEQGDNALWQGAMLSADTFWRFGDEIDRAAALNLLDALANRFPMSALTAQAQPHVRRLSDAPVLSPVPGFGAGPAAVRADPDADAAPALEPALPAVRADAPPPASSPVPPAPTSLPPRPEPSDTASSAPARPASARPDLEPRASSTPRSTPATPAPASGRAPATVSSVPVEDESGAAPPLESPIITAAPREPAESAPVARGEPPPVPAPDRPVAAPPAAPTTGAVAAPQTARPSPETLPPPPAVAPPPAPPAPEPAPAVVTPAPTPVPPAAAPVPALPAGPARLTAISGETIGDAIRFTLDVEREVSIRHEQLGGPPRIVIDLQDTMPAETLTQAWLPRDADVISRIRLGRHDVTWTRVVIELRAPSRYAVFVVADHPYRVLIDVHPRLDGLSTGAR